MGWRHLQKPVTVKCTKAVAKEFAEMTPAPHDRNFNPNRASFLKAALSEGRFRLADFASVYCVATKKTYRVNGKHTSLVLCDMNGSFPSDLYVTVERYEADTLEDVAKLYSTFDHKRSLRTVSDINKSFSAAHPDLAEIPSRIINTCVTALSFATWEDQYHQHEVEQRAAMLLEHPNFAVWVYFLIQGHASHRHPIMRGAIVAAMFRTFQKHQKQSTEFWEFVRDESHPDNVHPTRVLAKWINTHTMRTGAVGAKKTSGVDSQRGMYVRSIHAWNAYREGETITELKFFEKAKTPAVK